MKQKVVIKVSMNGQKSQSKALKTVVGVAGVESAALQGKDKDQIEVVGEGVDAVVLTTLLRKNIGAAELVSVGEKKEEKKPEPSQLVPFWPPYPNEIRYSHYPIYHYPEYSNRPDSCSIL